MLSADAIMSEGILTAAQWDRLYATLSSHGMGSNLFLIKRTPVPRD